jgi:hypothetical protein
MSRIWVSLLVSALIAIPAAGQSVFVKCSGQSVRAAKDSLSKYTHYKLSKNADHTILEVRQETWSRTFLGPRTTAIIMKLVSAKGRLLWSRTEPVGSRSDSTVVQDLLKHLAKARIKTG